MKRAYYHELLQVPKGVAIPLKISYIYAMTKDCLYQVIITDEGDKDGNCAIHLAVISDGLDTNFKKTVAVLERTRYSNHDLCVSIECKVVLGSSVTMHVACMKESTILLVFNQFIARWTLFVFTIYLDRIEQSDWSIAIDIL